VKFNDAGLIGIPKWIILGQKYLTEGKVEVQDRKKQETLVLAFDEVVSYFT